jgi:hypothetical protein
MMYLAIYVQTYGYPWEALRSYEKLLNPCAVLSGMTIDAALP